MGVRLLPQHNTNTPSRWCLTSSIPRVSLPLHNPTIPSVWLPYQFSPKSRCLPLHNPKIPSVWWFTSSVLRVSVSLSTTLKVKHLQSSGFPVQSKESLVSFTTLTHLQWRLTSSMSKVSVSLSTTLPHLQCDDLLLYQFNLKSLCLPLHNPDTPSVQWLTSSI